jgi:hypothetical protein
MYPVLKCCHESTCSAKYLAGLLHDQSFVCNHAGKNAQSGTQCRRSSQEYPAALDGDDNLVRELAYCKTDPSSLSGHKLSTEQSKPNSQVPAQTLSCQALLSAIRLTGFQYFCARVGKIYKLQPLKFRGRRQFQLAPWQEVELHQVWDSVATA